MHDILMITYNRADCTRMARARLLDSCDESMRVRVWHNGGHEETLDVVRQLSTHPRFHPARISREPGWEPKEMFATGLRKTVQWYLDHGDWIVSIEDGSYRGERLGTFT